MIIRTTLIRTIGEYTEYIIEIEDDDLGSTEVKVKFEFTPSTKELIETIIKALKKSNQSFAKKLSRLKIDEIIFEP